jgi:hypothetical protein
MRDGKRDIRQTSRVIKVIQCKESVARGYLEQRVEVG